MQQVFGFLLFVVGAVLFLATLTAFVMMEFQSIFFASLIISIFLLVAGSVLAYEPTEEFSQKEQDTYRKNSSISDRLGQL